MKTKHLFLTVFCSIFCFSSCEQNEINEDVNNPQPISFEYQGNHYSSTYQLIGNKPIIANSEVANIQEKLSQNPELATLISEDGTKIYFDNYEALTNYLEQKEVTFTTNPTTRAGGNTCTVGLYANTKYKGTSKTFTFSVSGTRSAAYNDLSTIGLLNAISSIKLATNYFNIIDNGSVTLWENKNFSGHSITWRTTMNTNNPINISNLESYGMNLPPLLPKSWNDAAQSAKVGF